MNDFQFYNKMFSPSFKSVLLQTKRQNKQQEKNVKFMPHAKILCYTGCITNFPCVHHIHFRHRYTHTDSTEKHLDVHCSVKINMNMIRFYI